MQSQAVALTLPCTPARQVVNAREVAAREVIGPIARGERVVGLTGGQFSLMDMVSALLEQSGPADVLIATWTAGVRDAELAAETVRDGRVRSLRLLVDRSFVSRQPQYARRLAELYGPETVRTARLHAKFVIIDGPRRRFLVTTSMNLNQNRRVETFDISESADLVAWWWAQVERLWEITPPGLRDHRDSLDLLDQAYGEAEGGREDVKEDPRAKAKEQAAHQRPGAAHEARMRRMQEAARAAVDQARGG